MKSLFKFKQFVDEINNENGRNYKISVLQKYKDDNVVKYYLDFVFNPYVITGISDKKLNKKVDCAPAIIELEDIDDTDIFNYIKEYNTGRDTDIKTVQMFKNDFVEEELYTLFDSVITKNLQLGIDVKTINKVIPNLIPEFSVQLANKYFDKPEIINGKEFFLTTKIDGMRCVMMKENGNITFWSRQGQAIEGLVDLVTEASNFPDNIVFDGELIAINTTKEDTYKNTMKLARTKEAEKHGLKMMVFDILDINEFKTQNCTIKYSFRRDQLSEIFKSEFNYFTLLPVLYQGSDVNKVTTILNEQVNNGEEGIMINLSNAMYDFKRTNNLLKVKRMQDLDLEIVDYFEGENSFANSLGGFIVRYKNNNLVKVGSGYSKEFRQEAWNNPKSYIGKIMVVQYFEETTNANGGISLRFPVFVDIRSDKTEPDY